MGSPAAKQDDRIAATDMHLIQPPGSSPPTMMPHQFSGQIDDNLSKDVKIDGRRAATVGSTATNKPQHIPNGGSFVNPPTNQGRITAGSARVRINGKQAARHGDTAQTCDDQNPTPHGTVQVVGPCTVNIG